MMIKNLVENTFQRATVASDYDELTVIVGKLRTQVSDLRHALRDTHQELDRLRAEVRDLAALRAEIQAIKEGAVVVAARPAPAPAPSAPEGNNGHAREDLKPAPAPIQAAPAAAPAAPATAAPTASAPAPAARGIAEAIAEAAVNAPAAPAEPDTGLHVAPDGKVYWGPIDNPSARAKAAGRTLVIDQPECISCGTCVEQTEVVFVLPDDSKAVAKAQEGPMDAIQDAIDACPVTCIHWVDDPNQFQKLNDESGKKLAS